MLKRWAVILLALALLGASLPAWGEDASQTDYYWKNTYHFKLDESASVEGESVYALFDPFNLQVTDYIFDDYDWNTTMRAEEAPFAVRRGHAWGFIDTRGEVVIPYRYESARSFDGALAAVKLDGKWGFIDRAGEWVVRPTYSKVDQSGLGFSEGLLSVKKKGKGNWGFINQAGEQVIDTVYEDVAYFASGLCPVEKGGKWGYIDAEGKMAIAPAYEDAFPFFEENAGCAEVYNKGGYGLIDRSGALLIPCAYTEIGFEEDGCTVACETGAGMDYYVLSEGRATPLKTLTAAIEIDDYKPFESDKLAVLDEKETLAKRVSEDTLPRLDGAIALLPVYAAFVQALYPADTRYDATDEGDGPLITCTNTKSAYERLINREADVIFVAQPSDEELAMAEAAGVEFDLIPFGKEAFVFFVNRDNPLNGITLDQIRDVYAGELTHWSDLGVYGLGDIVAYQRPKNSGSQTAMEALMGDIPLADAPEAVVAFGMGDILNVVEYRNQPNALGYSFRFFTTGLTGSQVKLLRVDGVPPLEANIRSGRYPITSTLYAIRLKDNENPNVRALLDWIQGPQGMELVEKTGYTPWVEYNADGTPVTYDLPMALEDWDEVVPLANGTLMEAAGGSRQNLSDALDFAAVDYLLARRGDQWALLNAQGQVLLRPCMDWPDPDDLPFALIGEHGVAGAVRVGGKWGLVAPDGTWLLPAEYDRIDYYGEDAGVHAVCRDGKWGYLTDEGDLMTDVCFDEIDWSASDDNALHVVRDGLHGFLTPNGRWLAEPVYEKAADRFTDGHAAVKRDGKWGYLNADGRLGIPCQYYAAETFMDLYAVVQAKKGTYGVINAQGAYVLEPEVCESIERVLPKFVVVTQTVKTKKGKKRTEQRYYNLYPSGAVPVDEDDGAQLRLGAWAPLEYGDRFGVEDGNGRCVLAPVYAEVRIDVDAGTVVTVGDDGAEQAFDLSAGAAKAQE